MSDNFRAFQYASLIASTIDQRYTVSPFDATRVQVITPTPDAAAWVSETLNRAGIVHRANGNDVILDVPNVVQAAR